MWEYCIEGGKRLGLTPSEFISNAVVGYQIQELKYGLTEEDKKNHPELEWMDWARIEPIEI
jgi:hypothetical protein